MKKNMRKKATVAVIIALTLFILAAFDHRLLIREYRLESPEADSPIRLVLLTDLHSCRYGRDQQRLIRAVREQEPDIILLGGDFFDDEMADEGAELCLRGITDAAPCYYVTGNHEYWSGRDNFETKMAILEKYGVTRLSDSFEVLDVQGQRITLCGLDDPDSYMAEFSPETEPMLYTEAQINKKENFAETAKSLSEVAAGEGLSLLLSHRPEFFELYGELSFDLVLCGHAHGGQWRLPGVLNGLYAPDQGIFPKYAGGRYGKGGMTMIVSRGLARESTMVPRIFNRPELVTVEIY